jgi:hypothetical protein
VAWRNLGEITIFCLNFSRLACILLIDHSKGLKIQDITNSYYPFPCDNLNSAPLRVECQRKSGQKMTGEDRRIYPRAEVRWPVSAMTAEGSVQGETMNLSMMGAFISCSKPLRLNETVALTINIPDTDHSLTVRAQVVWSNVCVSGDEKSPNGMGVRFIWHSPATSVGREQ